MEFSNCVCSNYKSFTLFDNQLIITMFIKQINVKRF